MNTIYNKRRLTPAQMRAILYRRALLNVINRPKLAGKGRKKKKCTCKQKGRGVLSSINNHHMTLGKFNGLY